VSARLDREVWARGCVTWMSAVAGVGVAVWGNGGP